MNSRLLRLMISLSVIPAVILFIWFITGPADPASQLWAQTSEEMSSVETCTYRIEITAPVPPGCRTPAAAESINSETFVSHSSVYGTASDTYIADTLIRRDVLDFSSGIKYSINYDTLRYIKLSLSPEMLSKTKDDLAQPVSIVNKVLAADSLPLGRAQINGINVRGLETTNPAVTGSMFPESLTRLWVDDQTALPVLIEIDLVSPTAQTVTMTITDFEWNRPLRPAFFAPQVPEDFTLTTEAALPPLTAGSVVKGLTAFQDISGGLLPTALDPMTLTFETRTFLNDLGEDGPATGLAAALTVDIQMLSVIYSQLQSLGLEPQYDTQNARTQDINTPLMTWNLPDGNTQIIYPDLVTEITTAPNE